MNIHVTKIQILISDNWSVQEDEVFLCMHQHTWWASSTPIQNLESSTSTHKETAWVLPQSVHIQKSAQWEAREELPVFLAYQLRMWWHWLFLSSESEESGESCSEGCTESKSTAKSKKKLWWDDLHILQSKTKCAQNLNKTSADHLPKPKLQAKGTQARDCWPTITEEKELTREKPGQSWRRLEVVQLLALLALAWGWRSSALAAVSTVLPAAPALSPWSSAAGLPRSLSCCEDYKQEE